jgi:hypothetical protein
MFSTVVLGSQSQSGCLHTALNPPSVILVRPYFPHTRLQAALNKLSPKLRLKSACPDSDFNTPKDKPRSEGREHKAKRFWSLLFGRDG